MWPPVKPHAAIGSDRVNGMRKQMSRCTIRDNLFVSFSYSRRERQVPIRYTESPPFFPAALCGKKPLAALSIHSGWAE